MIRDARDPCEEASPNDPVHKLRLHLAELKEYVKYLSDVRLAKLSHSLRKVAISAGLAGACAFLTAVAGALSVILTMVGLARLIGTATDRMWLGELIVGAGVLLLLTAAAAIGVASVKKKFRRKTMLTFEGRKEKQRVQFGRSVERAAREEVGTAVSGGGNGRGKTGHKTHAP